MAELFDKNLIELLKIKENSTCVDCNIQNPQWTSITYGVSFGVTTSFVKKFLESKNLLEHESNEKYFNPQTKNYGKKLREKVFLELGIEEENVKTYKTINRNNFNSQKYYEPKIIHDTKINGLQNKLYGTLNFFKSGFMAGVREVKNKTYEYGEIIGKNVIIPTTKMIKTQSNNLSEMWKQEPKKEIDHKKKL
ncbi:zinc finger protein [Vairimorpha apis BRL 01]|uniref:Zinc finger protein n=1 Tax=Vairimorpha apis BRL 01 TaxID=1037528 RepID=T0MI33_9MICR|nr:zinc finger protein [Vairimorpha apis BRL 01]